MYKPKGISETQIATSLSPTCDEAVRTRINSQHLRELTLGKFLIKDEHISLLENIGQGNRDPISLCIIICVTK